MGTSADSGVPKHALGWLLFSFRGRIDRRTYWTWFLVVTVGSIVALHADFLLLFALSDSARPGGIERPGAIALPGLIAVALFVATVWATFALQAKRFHDRGLAGWWCLVGLITVLGQLAVVAYTALAPGEGVVNRYGPPSPDPRGRTRILAAFVGGLVLLVAILFGGRAYVAEPFSVPSGSNVPTLLPGDYVLVSKIHPAQRGDLVAFTNQATGDTYIKRVVGVPGDTVQLRKGVLIVNDAAWPRERVADYADRYWDDFYGRAVIERRYRYTETKPDGSKHDILGGLVGKPEDSMAQDNTQLFTVPPGQFFVLGDNRDNSNDSRMQLGNVPFASVIGRVECRYFSFEPGKGLRGFWTRIRWGRLFTAVG